MVTAGEAVDPHQNCLPIMSSLVTEVIPDRDRDEMHVLPLAIVPLQTQALARARLVKNLHLDSVVELFTDDTAGSGQISIDGVATEFGWPSHLPHPDLTILQRLAILPSFDVYSLRIQLRQHGIPVNRHDALRLSPRKQQELIDYMKVFTRPLVAQVYGQSDADVDRFDDLIAMFRDPDVRRARERLRMLASRLQIGLMQLPRFLEEYGDIFLSMSYFRSSLDSRVEAVKEFRRSVARLRDHWELRRDSGLMRSMAMVEEQISAAVVGVAARMTRFDEASRGIWTDISAARFREVRRLVTNSHTAIGGLLCAVAVKMDGWTGQFPDESVGGPKTRAEFIMSEMQPGIDRLRQIQSALGAAYGPA